MKFVKIKCPVVWYCFTIDDVIKISIDSIYNNEVGWCCACGNFVKGDDALHEIRIWGIRESCIIEDDDNVYSVDKLNKSISVCCECGKSTTRYILGSFICKDCYPYDYDEVYGCKTEKFKVIRIGSHYPIAFVGIPQRYGNGPFDIWIPDNFLITFP